MDITLEIIKILKKNLKGLTIEEIFDILISEKIISFNGNEEKNEILSSIYIELLDNNNFILIENKKWILRSNINVNKIKNLSLSMTKSLSFLTNFNFATQNEINTELTDMLNQQKVKKRGPKRKKRIKISDKINSNQERLNIFKSKKISNEINHTGEIDWDEAEKNLNENN